MYRRFVLAAVTTAIGCGVALAIAGYPPEARRKEPPKDIATTALAVGKVAPDFVLKTQANKTWSLAEHVKAHKRTVVVFYRGDW